MVERTVLFDDLDGTQGAERIELTINGRTWLIDMAKASRDRFDRALAPFLEVAHPVGRHPRTKPEGPSPVDVRAWCAEQGIEVAAKGKIPDEVMQRYLSRG